MDPATLPRHELAGLSVRVVAATDPTLVDLAGEVVDETTNTLLIAEAATGRTKQVPKAIATFEFQLPDGVAVTVEGTRLVARPARRTEQTGESTWR